MTLILLLGSITAGCSGPQPLPEAPTAIPTLIPATLPAVSAIDDKGVAEVNKPAGGEYSLGQRIFDANCKACHKLTDEKLVGPGLGGLFERMPELSGGRSFSVENLIDWVKIGGGAMPGFGHLTDDELTAVVEFLKVETGPADTSGEDTVSEPADTDAKQSTDSSQLTTAESETLPTPMP